MAEFLRDPIWQFIGATIAAVFGILAIVEAILRRQQQLRSKQLSYFATSTVIAHSPPATQDALQISYGGTPITDLELQSITVQNTGNAPIAPTDFVEPLRFDFGKDARVLKAEVVDRTPEDIKASVTIGSSAATLAPLLLNRRDHLLLLVYVTGSKALNVTGRIVGVERIVSLRLLESEDGWLDRMLKTTWVILPILGLVALALILRSEFLLGFSVAGIAGYVVQRVRLRSRIRV